MNNEIVELLIRHEGLRLTPYRCTAGKLTIGVGHNLENGITKQEAIYILENDIARCSEELGTQSWYLGLNPVRKMALINMNFNLGFPRFLKFKKMIHALATRDFDIAANEMLDSNWAKQVGHRADELAQMIRLGAIMG